MRLTSQDIRALWPHITHTQRARIIWIIVQDRLKNHRRTQAITVSLLASVFSGATAYGVVDPGIHNIGALVGGFVTLNLMLFRQFLLGMSPGVSLFVTMFGMLAGIGIYTAIDEVSVGLALAAGGIFGMYSSALISYLVRPLFCRNNKFIRSGIGGRDT